MIRQRLKQIFKLISLLNIGDEKEKQGGGKELNNYEENFNFNGDEYLISKLLEYRTFLSVLREKETEISQLEAERYEIKGRMIILWNEIMAKVGEIERETSKAMELEDMNIR